MKFKVNFSRQFWVCMVICCGLGASDSKLSNKVLTRRFLLDRTAPNYISPGYYVNAVDRTTFSVSHPIYLEGFDVSRIFLYDPTEEIFVDHAAVPFRLVEIYRTNFKDKATILAGQVLLNSTYDAKVKFSTDLILDKAFVYEIRLEMPKDLNFMYNEYLKIKEYQIKRPFGRSMEINLYQYNSDVRPPNSIDSRRKVSQGMVKRLYFKYPIFWSEQPPWSGC